MNKIFLALTITIMLFLITSCSGLTSSPLIPDTIKERTAFVNSEEGDIQYFEVEGFKVTFYKKQMRIVIETTHESSD